MKKLISELITQGHLKSPAVIKAFERIKRRDFMPADLAAEESINAPLPIGHGQTISQPLTVAFMLELLDLFEGQKVLDIGSGSGWTTALLAAIVGPTGRVFAIERIRSLKEFGESNVRKYSFNNIEFFCQDGSKGLKESEPFDRILVSASAFEIPEELKRQLKIGGRLVIPTTANDIRLIHRVDKNNYREEIYPGFVFVPLVEG